MKPFAHDDLVMKKPKSEEQIFCAALEIPAEQRGAFLKEICGEDTGLLASISRLLQIHDTEDDFLATPALGVRSITIDERPGDRIGDYELLRKVGEGGFGIVWEALQLQPIKRRVALKIVKLGMDSQSIVERFDDERQTLALMSHSNIATVLDAGVTELGRPFFAMEFVEGQSIDQFCDQRELAVAQRLKIFVSVCRGVQHAHQKGIVHRDLKPSNILVAADEDQVVPKVIDFGIATAVQSELPDSDLPKSETRLVGTPHYMSPEQWNHEADVDTRSDIYSLGVVLTRLLNGAVSELNPPAEQAKSERPADSKRLLSPKTFDEDLIWMTRTAMCENRDERYQSASELALDIENYLQGQPVSAHPGGRSYLIKKFVKRNRLVVGSAMLALVALIVGICASTWGMLYANEQRVVAVKQKQLAQENENEAVRLKEIAEAEARKLRVVANVLKNMLPEAKPYRGMKSGMQVRQHLDQLINSVDTLSSEPELEAGLRITAARVYENISRFGWARLQYSKAHAIRSTQLGPQHPKTLLCRASMAACNLELGKLDLAEQMIDEVIEQSADRAPRVHVNALRTLRRIRNEQERNEEAFEIAELCRELAKGVFKKDIFGRINVANEYSMSAMKIGLVDEAENLVRESLIVLERDHPQRKFVIANTKHRLAEILMAAEKYPQAHEHATAFVEIQSELLGENDNYVVRGLVLLSEIQRRQQQFALAQEYATEAVARAETLEPGQIAVRRTALRQLAKVLEKVDPEQAAEAWETANKLSWELLGGNVSVAADLLTQARLCEQLDRLDQSIEQTKRAINILEHRRGTLSKRTQAYEFYSQLLDELGQNELAKRFREKASKLKASDKQGE